MNFIPLKLLGDARVSLRTLKPQSVQTIITSPPYWGLRSYKTTPLIWGGKADCEHNWGGEIPGRVHYAGDSIESSTLGAGSGGNQEIKLPGSCFCETCGAWRGELGSEPTLGLYLQNIVEVFRECRRVLRDDGTLWVNIGDAYANNSSGNPQRGIKDLADKWSPRKNKRVNHRHADRTDIYQRKHLPEGFKLKSLMMIPARVALALEADGWIIRSMSPWLKRNSMPESAQDRPATATEYIFMFSKKSDYFYDRFAVMVAASLNSHPRMSQDMMAQKGSERAYGGRRHNGRMKPSGNHLFDFDPDPDKAGINPKALTEAEGRATNTKQHAQFQGAMSQMVSRRNRRNSDWFFESWQGLVPDEEGNPLAFLINPKGTKIKHFAAYPVDLVRPMILGSTSEKGHCAKCHAPFMRVVENGEPDLDHQKASGSDSNGEYHGNNTKDYQAHSAQPASTVKARVLAGMCKKKVMGWECRCLCVVGDTSYEGSYPCTVLDPFWGTGTTGEAATQLGRRSIGCELNPEYFKDSDIKDAQGALAVI